MLLPIYRLIIYAYIKLLSLFLLAISKLSYCYYYILRLLVWIYLQVMVNCYVHFVSSYALVWAMEVNVFKLGISGNKSGNDLVAHIEVSDVVEHLT